MTSDFKSILAKAKTGDVNAMRELGCMYRFGDGVEKNIKNAIYCYQKTAKLNDVESQFNLGYIYFSGEGVEADLKKGLGWLQKAADQGHKTSQRIVEGHYNNKDRKVLNKPPHSSKSDQLKRSPLNESYEQKQRVTIENTNPKGKSPKIEVFKNSTGMPTLMIYVAAGMLFIGALPLPYAYYQLLRLVACSFFIWASVVMNQRQYKSSFQKCCIIAILFNPVIPIHLSKPLWVIIDIAIGIYALLIKSKLTEQQRT